MCVFFSFKKKTKPTLIPSPSCFCFYFPLMFPSGKEQFWLGLFSWLLKYKITLAALPLQDVPACMEWELVENLAH